jgi:TRAP transporter TAXI family solute receptor
MAKLESQDTAVQQGSPESKHLSNQTSVEGEGPSILIRRKRTRREVWALVKAGDLDALTDPELYTLIAWTVFGIVAALALFFTVVNPGPPKVLLLSTGSPTGAYFALAQEYKKKMIKHGVQVEVLESTGSLQNLARLRKQEMLQASNQESYPVMAAFVQSGTGTEEDLQKEWMESLASVAYEPIWVFHSLGKEVQRLAELVGKRVAIGAPGSGVQFAAKKLLEKTGINASNTKFQELGGEAALAALNAGQVDAIILVAGPASKAVAAALEKNLGLLNFAQADAYLRNFPWLQKVTLPRGSVDLSKDLPPSDVSLIAATANLVVHKDLHPSLAFLLLDTASEIHSKAGLTHVLKEFPSEKSLEFKQSDESKRYFKSGRPFLQNYLPFWLANLVERLMTGVVPILIVLIPLIKLIPAFFSWREKARVSRLYSDVKKIEDAYNRKTLVGEEAQMALAKVEKNFDELNANSPDLANLYNAKSHLELLRTRIGTGVS